MKALAAILTLALSLLPASAWGQAKAPGGKSGRDVVVATVGGKPLTLADFLRLLERLPPQVRAQAMLQKEAILNNLVNRELLYHLAVKENLEKRDEIQRRLAQVKHDLLVQEAYRARVVEPSEVADTEARAHYEKNKEKFRTPEQVTASHIMVKTQAEAEGLLKELKGGKKFPDLAKEKSLAPERPLGGTLGTFGRGHHEKTGLPKVIEDTALKLKDGEVSGVVKSVYGWHVVMTFKREAPKPRPFDQVREEIALELRDAKQEKLLGDLIKRLRGETKVELFPDRIP